MEAVIQTGGKQYRVAPGQVIKVERLSGAPGHAKRAKGEQVEFTDVRLVVDDGRVAVGPGLASARVTGEVLAERKQRKVLVVKFKRRKNYRRRYGHRQTLTSVRIVGIEV
jgi:large subunit ribosomal protein L21